MHGVCIRDCDGKPPGSKAPTTIPCTPPGRGPKKPQPMEICSPIPVPYTFRVPVPTSTRRTCRGSMQAQQAKSPPFCLQLDHTLAVVWCLFRKKANKCTGSECVLGVGQLQWALYFLKGIKPPGGGERAEDVSLAINAVEDALLEVYAEMSAVVLQQLGSGCEPAPETSEGSHCTVCSGHKRLPVPQWVPEAPISTCKICSSVSLGQGRPRKSPRHDEFTPVSTPTSYKTPSCTKSMTKAVRGWQGPIGQCTRDRMLEEEIRQLKRVAAELSKHIPGSDTDSQDTESDAIEMSTMQEWRKEQVNRVQEELWRLRSLDSALGIDPDVTEACFRTPECFSPKFNSTKRSSHSR